MADPKRERRREERFPLRLVIEVDGTRGITRDISVSGLLFEIPTDATVGDEIDLKVFTDTSDGKLVQKCHGSVVRLERRAAKSAIAVKITDSVMEQV